MLDRLKRLLANQLPEPPAATPATPGTQAAAAFRLKNGLPDWKALVATNSALWQASRARAASGPHVLLATNVGGHGPVSVVESMLAVALTLRGARVHTLLCDAALPGCLHLQCTKTEPAVLAGRRLAESICVGCVARGKAVFHALDLDHHLLNELITPEEAAAARNLAAATPLAKIGAVELDGLALGEHALAGALRYYARGEVGGEPLGEVVAQRYLEASLRTVYAMRRLLGQHPFRAAAFHHGIYVPQGLVGEACREAGVRVANWVVAYRKHTLIFSHEDTYHHTLLDEPTDTWRDMPWNDALEQEVLGYLKSRWYGTRDWIYFHEKPDEDFQRYMARTGIDTTKPIIGMLTNVFWDAQLHYRANAFANMLEWCKATIDYFRERPGLQLLIRVHPAEIRGTVPSRQPLVAELEKQIGALPPNIFLIPPESPVSTYAAMEACDSVLIYGTKTGVELTSLGIPVVVAGEAWIRGKGLTMDATSPSSYREILDRLPLGRRMDETVVREARKYAYHFFFRRMLELPFLDAEKGFGLTIQKLDDLLPGKHPALDVICDGILEGAPFVHRAERQGAIAA